MCVCVSVCGMRARGLARRCKPRGQGTDVTWHWHALQGSKESGLSEAA